MNKNSFFSLAILASTLLLVSCQKSSGPGKQPTGQKSELEGVWEANKEKGGKEGSLVLIYPHENMYYGQIIATYDDLSQGVKETINDKNLQIAPGVVGDQPYCGINMVWVDNSTYEGYIVDPEQGKKYHASMKVEDGVLILRGKFGPFFSDRPWPKAPDDVLSKAFPNGLPDPSAPNFNTKLPELK